MDALHPDTQHSHGPSTAPQGDVPQGDKPAAADVLVKLVTTPSSSTRIQSALRAARRQDVIAAIDTILDCVRRSDNTGTLDRLRALLNSLDAEAAKVLVSHGDPKRRMRRLAAAGLKFPFTVEALDPAINIVEWESLMGTALASRLDPSTWHPFLDEIDRQHRYACRDTLLLWQALWRGLSVSGSERGQVEALHYVDAMDGLTPLWRARMIVAASLTADTSSFAFFTAIQRAGYLHETGVRDALVALGADPVVREAFSELPLSTSVLRAFATPVIDKTHFGYGICQHYSRYRGVEALHKAGLLTNFGVSLSDYNPTVIGHAADADAFLAMIDATAYTGLSDFMGRRHYNELAAILWAGDEYITDTVRNHDLSWLLNHRAAVVRFFRLHGIAEQLVFSKLYANADRSKAAQ